MKLKVYFGISIKKWLQKQKNPSKRQSMLKITTNPKSIFYEDKKIQDIMNEFYLIKKAYNDTFTFLYYFVFFIDFVVNIFFHYINGTEIA